MPAANEIERTLKNAFRSIAVGPERLRTGALPQLRCICRRNANARAKPAGLDDAEQIKLQIKSNWARRPRVTDSRGAET
jgi:hypothetical protein